MEKTRKWEKLQVEKSQVDESYVPKEDKCEAAILGASRLTPKGHTSLNQSSLEDSLLAGDRLALKLRPPLVLYHHYPFIFETL